MERRAGRGERGSPGDPKSPLGRQNIFKRARTKTQGIKRSFHTPGPREADTSGEEEAGNEGKAEEEFMLHQKHHIFHLGDWHDFFLHHLLISVPKDLRNKQV